MLHIKYITENLNFYYSKILIIQNTYIIKNVQNLKNLEIIMSNIHEYYFINYKISYFNLDFYITLFTLIQSSINYIYIIIKNISNRILKIKLSILINIYIENRILNIKCFSILINNYIKIFKLFNKEKQT